MAERIKVCDGAYIYRKTEKGKNGKTYESKVWYADYVDDNGKRRQHSTRLKDKTAAEDYLKVRVGRIAAGKKSGYQYDQTTFQDLQKLIVDHYKDTGQKRPRVRHLERLLGHLRANEITQSTVKDYIKQREKEGAKNGTVRNELAALRFMFNLGVAEGVVHPTQKPVIGVKAKTMPKPPRRRDRILSVEELILLNESLFSIAPYWGCPVLFARLTMWRAEEVLELKRDWIEGDIIRVPAENTKEREERVLHMNQPLQEFIEERKAEMIVGCPYLFHDHGEKISILKHKHRKDWNQACRESGLGHGYSEGPKYREEWKQMQEGPTLHTLRHSIVSLADSLNLSAQDIMSVSGHKTPDMIAWYTHKNGEDQKRVLDAIHEAQNGNCDGFCDGQVISMTKKQLNDLVQLVIIQTISGSYHGAWGEDRTRTRHSLKGF